MKNSNQNLRALLLLSVIAASPAVMAVESGVDGNSSINDTPFDSAVGWLNLNGGSVTIAPPFSEPYHCVVTCAATFKNPDTATDANYYLGIGLGAADPAATSQQVISFPSIDTVIDDIEWGPVTTTYLFTGLTGNRTFNCKVKKVSPEDPNGVVENAKITAACSKYRW